MGYNWKNLGLEKACSWGGDLWLGAGGPAFARFLQLRKVTIPVRCVEKRVLEKSGIGNRGRESVRVPSRRLRLRLAD